MPLFDFLHHSQNIHDHHEHHYTSFDDGVREGRTHIIDSKMNIASPDKAEEMEPIKGLNFDEEPQKGTTSDGRSCTKGLLGEKYTMHNLQDEKENDVLDKIHKHSMQLNAAEEDLKDLFKKKGSEYNSEYAKFENAYAKFAGKRNAMRKAFDDEEKSYHEHCEVLQDSYNLPQQCGETFAADRKKYTDTFDMPEHRVGIEHSYDYKPEEIRTRSMIGGVGVLFVMNMIPELKKKEHNFL